MAATASISMPSAEKDGGIRPNDGQSSSVQAQEEEHASLSNLPLHPHSPTPFNKSHGSKIAPPTTTGDKGLPTPDILRDAERVFEMIRDERHLVAHKLLVDVRKRIQVWQESGMKGSTSGGGSPYMSRSQYKRIRRTSKRIPKGLSGTGSNGGAATVAFSNTSGASTPKTSNTHSVYDLSSFEDGKYAKAKALLDSKEHEIETLENRCRLFRQAQRNLATDEDWIHASHHFGIHTYYRREESGSLSIKLEGTLEGLSLFEQICVLKEVDLHYTWAPFCCSSMTVAHLDKLDQVGWFIVGMPNFGLARDGCFRAIGCDNIEEDGTILMAAQGIQDDVEPTVAVSTVSSAGSVTSMGGVDRYLADDPVLQQLEIPPVSKRRGCGRMTIHKLEAMIQIKSPTSATTRIVANINPNIGFLPAPLLDFIMKHMAGVLLAKLQAAARKIGKHPKTNVHAQRMRAEAPFYRDWLLAKLQYLCKEKGWEMPPGTVFDYMERDEARLGRGRDLLRVRTFSGAAGDDNWSNNSTPQQGDDELSELSSQAGSNRSLHSARIRKFFSEFENRSQQKKALKIAEERQRAAERLKPKELTFDKQERLLELKSAIEARKRLGSADFRRARSAFEDVPKSSFSEIVTDRLNEHDRFTRVLVVTSLMILLFAMLHPLTVMSLPALLPTPAVQDAVVVAYILLCGLVHFALCDVALVYAFSSLDVGQKAGREVKLFYSANVRIAVAGASLLVFTISIITASAKVLALTLLKSAFQRASTIMEAFENGGTSKLTSVSRIVSGFRGVIGLLAAMGNIFVTFFVRSNSFGRAAIGFCATVYALFLSALDDVKTQSSSLIQGDEDGSQCRLPWREEAFNTAKVLFMNSAVFLLTILIIFHLSTRRVHRVPIGAGARASAVDDTDRSADDPLLPTSVRTASHAASTSARPRANTSYDTIPENEAVLSPGLKSENGSESSRSKIPNGSRVRSWTAPEARLLRKYETR